MSPDLSPRRIPRPDLLGQLADDLEANWPDEPYRLPPDIPADPDAIMQRFGINGDDIFTLFRNPERTGAFEAEIIRDWIARYEAAYRPTFEQLITDNGLHLSVANIGGEWRAAFDRTYVTDRRTNAKFWPVDGRGDTRDAAILDYQRAISGRVLARNDDPWLPIEKSPRKIVIDVPYWPWLFETAKDSSHEHVGA